MPDIAPTNQFIYVKINAFLCCDVRHYAPNRDKDNGSIFLTSETICPNEDDETFILI